VRQHDRAADDLVGLLGVDPETGRKLDRLVELDRLDPLGKPAFEPLESLDRRRNVDSAEAGDFFAEETISLGRMRELPI
jgi:hypothetical protein